MSPALKRVPLSPFLNREMLGREQLANVMRLAKPSRLFLAFLAVNCIVHSLDVLKAWIDTRFCAINSEGQSLPLSSPVFN